jgi:hypothetical protein
MLFTQAPMRPSASVPAGRLSGTRAAGVPSVRLLLTVSLTCAGFACAPGQSPPPVDLASSNPLLSALAREDQDARRGGSPARSDLERLRLVIGEIGAGRVHTTSDRTNAALVLQHSPLTFRDNELVAISPHDYLLAHHLARAAFEAGDSTARHLVAQTLDRFLSMTEGYQKYGTNRFINQATGEEELPFIDRATTDAERATYGVAPLAELLKQFPEAPRKPRPPR